MSMLQSPLRTTVIVHRDGSILSDLAQSISTLGFEVITSTPSFQETVRVIQSLKPSLVLVDIQSSGPNVLEIIGQLVSWRTSAIIALLDTLDMDLAAQCLRRGASGFMIKPFDARQISIVMECSWYWFQTIKTLQDSLALRRLLEQAKGILMEQHHISEEKAHQTLLKMSQDQGIPLKELCVSILHVRTILGEDKIKRN